MSIDTSALSRLVDCSSLASEMEVRVCGVMADPEGLYRCTGLTRRFGRAGSGVSESLAPGPADALSADPAISAPWAPVYSCLTGGGASSVVGGAGCSRGASAPGPPAGSCAGMVPDSCLRALKRLVYPRRRRRRVRVDGGGVLLITVFTLI